MSRSASRSGSSGAPSYSADKALPQSRLIVMDRGTHLAFYAHPDAADVQEEARVFLAANSRADFRVTVSDRG